MAKLRVQAQHLQAGDIVGSGEIVACVMINSTQWPSNKIHVRLGKNLPEGAIIRSVYWGKTTMIGVERVEKVNAD